MKPYLIQQEFFRLCRDYAVRIDALGTNQEQQKKDAVFSVILHSMKIELIYRSKSTAGLPPSVLYCRIYPDKNCPIGFHLPQLLSLLDIRDFRACYFPYIETTQRMKACFQSLTDFIDILLPELRHITSNGDEQILLSQLIMQTVDDADTQAILKPDSSEQQGFLMVQKMQNDGYIARFTQWTPWYEYIMGHPQKALSQYRKQKTLLPYELHLCSFLQTEKGKAFVPMSPECCAAKDMAEATSCKEDGGTLFKGMLLLYLLFAPLACLLFGIIQLIGELSTICWFGVPWYCGFIVAGLPALFGGLAFRRRLIPLINRKNAKTQLEFDDIINHSVAVDRFAKIVFIIAAVFSLTFGVLMATDTIAFYHDRVVYKPATFSVEEVPYSEINAIYHIDARYNDFGERLERSSYVIAFDNGSLLDLDGYATPEQTESKILPTLKNLEIPVFFIDSDQDLP